MSDEQTSETVALQDVKVDTATAQALQAWVYPTTDGGAPASLMIERLERNHLDGTVSLVLRSDRPQ